MENDRRNFLRNAGTLTASIALIGSGISIAQEKSKKDGKAEEISPTEDLMREHGVLNRILLVYDEIDHRIDAKKEFNPALLAESADMISRFVEQYHEKIEEDHLFPRFEKAKKLTDLVAVLRIQHAAGRTVTAQIQEVVTRGLRAEDDKKFAQESMRKFIRMYRPHETREDTVLFPALHEIVSQTEFDAMGEEFEGIEKKTFGGDGFDMAVDQITKIEKALGIYDLAQFTPK